MNAFVFINMKEQYIHVTEDTEKFNISMKLTQQCINLFIGTLIIIY